MRATNQYSKLILLSFYYVNIFGNINFKNVTEIERQFLGTYPTVDTVPHVVLILGKNTGSVCTGTILTELVVLTLARCLFHNHTQQEVEASVKVIAGASDLEHLDDTKVQSRDAKRLIIHPNFKITKKDISFGYNDLVLILVNTPFQMTNVVKVIKVAETEWPTKTEKCYFAGYGAINPFTKSIFDSRLKKQEISMVKQCPCPNNLMLEFGFRSLRWFCQDPSANDSVDVGPCVGDAGSGLICHNKLYGISLGVIPYKDIKNCLFQHEVEIHCGDKNAMAVFLNLCPFLKWIHFNIKAVPRGPVNCSGCVELKMSHVLLFICVCVLFGGKLQN